MSNDRFYVRCAICGDYEWLGKYYPSTGAQCRVDPKLIMDFLAFHLTECQARGAFDFGDGPTCVRIDSEATLCAAGGLIGGSGNVHDDMKARSR